MKTTFLLISDGNESAWSAVLRETLAPLGSLRVIAEEKTKTEILHARCDLIIIDGVAVKEAARLVSHLRAQRPDMGLVVATVTPTWREARDVLRAGALDYFRRSLNKEELWSTIKDTLSKKPAYAETD